MLCNMSKEITSINFKLLQTLQNVISLVSGSSEKRLNISAGRVNVVSCQLDIFKVF